MLTRNPVLKIGLKSTLPTSLTLVYASVIMIKLRPTVMQEHQILQHQFTIFIFSWATYTTLSYLKRRKSHAALTGNVAYPMGRSFNDERLKPDERNWEYWSTSQFMNWVKYNFRERCDDHHVDDVDTIDHLLEVIMSQRIQGATLPHLGVDELRSIGLSYGDSVMLFRDICDLIYNYPSRTRHWDTRRSLDRAYNNNRRQESKDPAKTGIDLDAWLGKKIGQTEVVTEEDDDDDDEEESTRAQVYEPREAKAPIQKESSSEYASASAQSPNTDGMLASLRSASAQGTPGNVQLDQALLNAMPPNIREIASRRPDLVQALIASKNSNGIDTSSHNPNGAGTVTGPFKSDKSLEGAGIGNNPNVMEHDLYSIEEEIDDESSGWFGAESNRHEMLGLLRRRGKTE